MTDEVIAVPASKSGEVVYVLMDRQDVAALGRRKLSIGSHGYAQMFADGKVQLLHRWLMNAGPGDIVDHINRKPLDCRRINMRITDPHGSNMNRVTKPGKYGIGIKRQRSGRFSALVKRRRRVVYVGTYDTAEEAVAARAAYLLQQGEQ